jgi:hypothetical protein
MHGINSLAGWLGWLVDWLAIFHSIAWIPFVSVVNYSESCVGCWISGHEVGGVRTFHSYGNLWEFVPPPI